MCFLSAKEPLLLKKGQAASVAKNVAFITLEEHCNMNNASVDIATANITGISPQFLVDDLSAAVAYYRDRLGFEADFIYESFYASVSRDGFAIHLKCAPRIADEREHCEQNEHLDAYIGVSGIEVLFDELQVNAANIVRPLEERPWNCKDFYVEDTDGHILCFSEKIP